MKSKFDFVLEGKSGPYPYERGKHIVAVLELDAYGDESGINNAKYCLLLGYLGSPDVWASFDEQWELALQRNEVAKFHAIDFFQGRKQFKGWPGPKRNAVLEVLLRIIDSHHIWPIGWAVDVGAFNEMIVEERRYLTGAYIETKVEGKPIGNNQIEVSLQRKFKTSGAYTKPYFYVFHHFFTEAWSLMDDDTYLNVILDYQKLMKAGIERLWVEYSQSFNTDLSYDGRRNRRLGDITFSCRRLPLQAADLYAYCWNRFLNAGGKLTDGRVAFALECLCAKKPNLNIANKDYLQGELTELREQLCEDSLYLRNKAVEKLEDKR